MRWISKNDDYKMCRSRMRFQALGDKDCLRQVINVAPRNMVARKVGIEVASAAIGRRVAL